MNLPVLGGCRGFWERMSVILGETDEDMEQFKTEDILKVASLSKTKQECFLDIKEYSQKLSDNKLPIVVLDGAKSLWSLAESTFSDKGFVGILDIIHVRDYLYDAGHALHKEGSHKLTHLRHIFFQKALAKGFKPISKKTTCTTSVKLYINFSSFSCFMLKS